jgi:hypothetical protein
MIQKLGCALLCVPLICLTVWAQKESAYRTGRLLKVSDQSYVMPNSAGKTAYLLHIQDGSNEYFALYSVTFLFGHNRSNLLKPDSDIQYQVSGKSLFVRTQDSKDIKGRLCERIQSGVKCGGLVVFGKDAE